MFIAGVLEKKVLCGLQRNMNLNVHFNADSLGLNFIFIFCIF